MLIEVEWSGKEGFFEKFLESTQNQYYVVTLFHVKIPFQIGITYGYT